MVQFQSINFFSWISSIFVGVFQKFPFFCVTLYKCNNSPAVAVGGSELKMYHNLAELSIPEISWQCLSWSYSRTFSPSRRFRQTIPRTNKTANVRITWHWRATVQPLLLWKSNEYYILWVCVCSLRYPACSTHAPYCHLRPAPLYNIFPHYLINGTIFGKKLLNPKRVFWFSVQLLSETFLHWLVFDTISVW